MSSFISISFSFQSLLECNDSWTMITLSMICLPSIKTPWFGEISLSRKGLILLARILEIILQEALQSDMGLNLAKEPGFVSLGIRARKVDLVQPLILDL